MRLSDSIAKFLQISNSAGVFFFYLKDLDSRSGIHFHHFDIRVRPYPGEKKVDEWFVDQYNSSIRAHFYTLLEASRGFSTRLEAFKEGISSCG